MDIIESNIITDEEKLNEIIIDIQHMAREVYIKILLDEYCLQCITNEDDVCNLFKMEIRDAIIIEKEVDCKSDRRLNYIGNCKTRLCYLE